VFLSVDATTLEEVSFFPDCFRAINVKSTFQIFINNHIAIETLYLEIKQTYLIFEEEKNTS
jgi:hypothetical protein